MALERVDFVELESPTPLRDVLARVQTETDTAVQEKLRPFVVMSRAQLGTRHAELEGLLDLKGPGSGSIPPGLRESLGDVATAFVVSSITASLIVVQSAEK
jgi:K+:H+ antiporter